MQVDGPFVVFIIGIRINKFWAIHKWLPAARAMGPMVEHLLAHRELGLMHVEPFVYWRGLAVAGAHLPAVGAKETAKRRLGLEGEPVVEWHENPSAPPAAQ